MNSEGVMRTADYDDRLLKLAELSAKMQDDKSTGVMLATYNSERKEVDISFVIGDIGLLELAHLMDKITDSCAKTLEKVKTSGMFSPEEKAMLTLKLLKQLSEREEE